MTFKETAKKEKKPSPTRHQPVQPQTCPGQRTAQQQQTLLPNHNSQHQHVTQHIAEIISSSQTDMASTTRYNEEVERKERKKKNQRTADSTDSCAKFLRPPNRFWRWNLRPGRAADSSARIGLGRRFPCKC